MDTAIPSQMLTPVTYGNGNQASPTSIATFTLHCQGFRTKVTCPILNLAEELDVVLGHKWCLNHQVIIRYMDEHVKFVHKNCPQILCFDDSYAQTHPASYSLYSIRQATHFVQRQQCAFLVMVRGVAELSGEGAKLLRNRPMMLSL